MARRAVAATPPDDQSGRREWLLGCVRCCDLTSLESDDDADKIARLARTARRPDPDDGSIPQVAALCTWPRLIDAARDVLEGSGVRLAAVAGGFPTGLIGTADKVNEVSGCLAAGADEVDVVINRSLLIDGEDEAVFEQVVAMRQAAGASTLKVILETGELEDPALVRQASIIALVAGADFIKTSTGKMVPGATREAAVVMADSIKDYYAATARPAGLKVAGGVRTAEEALAYVGIVRHTLGGEWFEPGRFRIGASSLLADLIARL